MVTIVTTSMPPSLEMEGPCLSFYVVELKQGAGGVFRLLLYVDGVHLGV